MRVRVFSIIVIMLGVALASVLTKFITDQFSDTSTYSSLIFVLLAAVFIIPPSFFIEKKFFPNKFAQKGTDGKMLRFVFSTSLIVFAIAVLSYVLTYSISSWMDLSRLEETIPVSTFMSSIVNHVPLGTALVFAISGTAIVSLVALVSIYILNKVN